MPKEREINLTVAQVSRELVKHSKGKNYGVYGCSEQGTVHLIEGVTKVGKDVIAQTPLGHKKIISAKVLE